MDPTSLGVLDVAGGVGTAGALLYLAHRALGVLEQWMARRRANGSHDPSEDSRERRSGDRVTHALLREQLTELRALRGDLREQGIRLESVQVGVEALRRER